MRAPVNVLRLTGIIFLAFGLAGLFVPTALLAPVGVLLPVPAAVAEMRGFYGGLEIGIGLFLLLSSRTPRYAEAATLLAALGLAGIPAGRLLGVLLDGPANLPFYLSGLMEAIGGLANAWAYRRLRRAG
jgi:hypothetical protein